MSATSINMHVAVGALSIGSSVNFMLLALELTQVYRYYRSYYERDPFFLKIVVATAVLLDCFQSATNASCVYGYTITHFGDYNNLLKQGFEIPVYLAVTGIVGGICQGYLTWRLFKLSKNWILVGIATLIVVAGTACAVLTAVFIVKYAEYSQRHMVVIPVTIWLTCEAAGDVLLAVSLIGFLFAYRSKTEFDRTKSLLQRLILMSAQSGSVTSIVALIALCIYLSDNEGNVSVGIAFCLGRLYTLTMLLNLNIRGAGNVQAGSSGGAGKTTTFAYPLGQTRMGRENAVQEETMHAITVQHDVNIHIDDERYDFTVEKRSVPVMFVNDQRETSDLEYDGDSQKSMSKVAYLPGQ